MDIKTWINQYPHINIEKIKKRIEKCNAVSFDIYDTLIKRDVTSPEDVFTMCEKIYNKRYGSNVIQFKKLRIEAERIARRKKRGKEVTLQEIYDELDEKMGELKTIEIELEKRITCINPVLKEIYEYCLEKKKKIFIISDTYLDSNLIKEILYKNGIEKYQALYVSSEYGVMKRTTELFQYILKKEKLAPGELIHIGDDKRSDYLMPKKLGIHSINIARKMRNTNYLLPGKDFERSIVYAFVNNRLLFCKNRSEIIGYEVYGTLLYGFVKWLESELDPNKTTFFFARDCYVVKEAYEKITKTQMQKNIYFLASRKSLITPALYKDCSLKQLEKLMISEPLQFTLEGLLRKCGLEPEHYMKIAKKYGFSSDLKLHRGRLADTENFLDFWNDAESLIKQNVKKTYHNFLAYLDSLEFCDEIQVVDIGWRGTMQYCLKNFLPDQYSICGCYLGVREDTLLDRLKYKGFYLDGENNEDKRIFLASMTALIEIFFSAPHGSVKGYDEEGRAVYDEWECIHDERSQKLLKDLHKGALKFVEDFHESPVSEIVGIDSDMIFDGLRNMGSRPKKEELRAFGNFPFHMGVGMVKAAAPDHLIKYLVNPKKAVYDFLNSNWKIAFMLRLFKIRLPYYSLFKMLYKNKR